jgi:hypothetical protein
MRTIPDASPHGTTDSHFFHKSFLVETLETGLHLVQTVVNTMCLAGGFKRLAPPALSAVRVVLGAWDIDNLTPQLRHTHTRRWALKPGIITRGTLNNAETESCF